MAVKFKQLSTWKAGGSPTTPHYYRGYKHYFCARPGLFGDKNEALVFGGYSTGNTSTCVEEYNGLTDVWATANALTIDADNVIGVGSTNAGIAFGFQGECFANNPSHGTIDLVTTMSATNPHDSSTVTRCVSEVSVEYDGTNWSNSAVSMEDSGGNREPGAWAAAAGVQNAAITFGGFKATTTDHSNAWALCSKKYDGTVWSHVTDITHKRGGLLGAGTENSALAIGGSTQRGPDGSCGTDAWRGSCNLATDDIVPTNYGGSSTTNAFLPTTYSCVEEYNGTNWSTSPRLLNPRVTGGAAGTSNDALIYNGYWAVGTTTSYDDSIRRLNATYLCCPLGTDHWNGISWSSDSISLLGTYPTNNDGTAYEGGRAGAVGDGNTSSTALSLDGVRTWLWDCAENYHGGPNASFCSELMLGGNDDSTTAGYWKGALTREFNTSKQSGIHFGPKVVNKGLSLYYDSGNYKNFFTNEYCNPLTADSSQIEVGRVGAGIARDRCAASLGEDAGFCGWTIGGGLVPGMPRSYANLTGKTNSALYYGGTVCSFTNYCRDTWRYDGTSWSSHDATLLFGGCMSTATGKNENDAITTGYANVGTTAEETAVWTAVDAEKDWAAHTYQVAGKVTQQLEGLTWTRGGDVPFEPQDCTSSGIAGHVNAAIANHYCGDNSCGGIGGPAATYDGNLWTAVGGTNTRHFHGVAMGGVNSALLSGGGEQAAGTNCVTSPHNQCSVSEEWDGTSWHHSAFLNEPFRGGAGSAADANQAIIWRGDSTQEYDGTSWKNSYRVADWSWQNYIGTMSCTDGVTDESTGTSANAALGLASTYANKCCSTYNGIQTGVIEWNKTSFRELKSNKDKQFHINNAQCATLQPSSSIGGNELINVKGEINTNFPDKNSYIALDSGSLSSDTYFATDSTTVGSVWSHNSPLITKRCFQSAAGNANSALVVGGIVSHTIANSQCTGCAKTCVEEYDGLTFSANIGIGEYSGNTFTTGCLNGHSSDGIWQHQSTGCNANSVTVHGGACLQASSSIWSGSAAPSMVGRSSEWNGSAWSGVSTLTGVMNNPRIGLASAGTSNSAVLFGGGYECLGTQGSMASLACTEEYDGKTYTVGGAMVETVCQGTGAGTVNAAIAFGGCCQVGGTCTGYSDISQEYDGSVWSSNASLNNPRWKPAGAGTQNSAVAIGGACRTGLTIDSNALFNCVEEYDGSAWANRSQLTVTSCDAAVGVSNKALSVGGGTYSAKYQTNTEIARTPKIIVNNANGGVTVGMWVRFPYGDRVDASNEWNNKTYLFANADIDSSTSGTFGSRDGDTMKGRAGVRLLRHNGKLRLEWSNYVGSANEADTSFDSNGNNLITSYWASTDGSLFNTTDWYHVVAMTDFSRTAANNKMYINGTLIANSAGVNNKTGGGLYDYEDVIYPNNNTSRISIGGWNGKYFSFDVSSVMYYDRILEPVEVHQTYNSFKSRYI